jgi:hypothetical protein
MLAMLSRYLSRFWIYFVALLAGNALSFPLKQHIFALERHVVDPCSSTIARTDTVSRGLYINK